MIHIAGKCSIIFLLCRHAICVEYYKNVEFILLFPQTLYPVTPISEEVSEEDISEEEDSEEDISEEEDSE